MSTNKHSTAHSHISRSDSQGLNTELCNWEANPVKLQWNAKHTPAVRLNNCFHRAVWIWRVAEGEVSLTFEPGYGGRGRRVSESVWCSRSGKSHCGTQRYGSTSVNRLTRAGKQITLKTSRTSRWWMWNFKGTNIKSDTSYFFNALLLKIGQSWLILGYNPWGNH